MNKFVEPLARSIDRYLASNDHRRKVCTSPEPLPRFVKVNWKTWNSWFQVEPRTVGITKVTIAHENTRMTAARFTEGRATPITRSELAVLAGADRNDSSRVELFVATMAWGSGTTNGRGPRNTARALADENLIDVLKHTQQHIVDGDIVAAYKAFRIDGVGEAFFTKWFWACSLQSSREPRPLILDLRVRATLWRALKTEEWRGPRRSSGYVDYIDLLHATADRLQPNVPNITAEKIEWLLFDRESRGIDDSEQCWFSTLPKPAD